MLPGPSKGGETVIIIKGTKGEKGYTGEQGDDGMKGDDGYPGKNVSMINPWAEMPSLPILMEFS